MIYYIILCVLALLVTLEFVNFSKKTKIAIYYIVVVFFILLGSLRWNTGNDWNPYLRYFTKFDSDDIFFLTAMEPGYARLIQFLRSFSTNFTVYLFILSITTIGLKAYFFQKYTNALFIALILYWGTNMSDITAVRQMLAISICCIATIYIIEKKVFWFLVFVYLAMQIHVTSAIFFIAYPLYYLRWPTIWKVVALVFSVIIGLIGGYEIILGAAIEILPGGLGLDRITNKALIYLEMGNENMYGTQLSKTQRMVAGVAKRAVLLPLFFLFEQYINQKKPLYTGLLNLYSFGNIFYFIIIDYSTLQRMVAYFYIFEIVLFCIIFENVKSKFVWAVIIILYSLMKLYSIVANTHHLLVPYFWIFSDNPVR